MRLGFTSQCEFTCDAAVSKGKRALQEWPGSFKAGTKAYVDQGAL